ncbi:hypothetical protein ACIQCQ_10110 [Streptomyces sp. NPDC088394]
MVIQARGVHAVVVRPGGQPWEVLVRQLDALARHVAYQRRGEERPR